MNYDKSYFNNEQDKQCHPLLLLVKYGTYFMRKVITSVTLKTFFLYYFQSFCTSFPAVFHLQHFIHSSTEIQLTSDDMQSPFCFILSLRFFSIHMQRYSCRGGDRSLFKLLNQLPINFFVCFFYLILFLLFARQGKNIICLAYTCNSFSIMEF